LSTCRIPKVTKLSMSRELKAFVHDKLAVRWSPQQISRALRHAYPDDPSLRLSHESIYCAIHSPSSGLLRKPAGSPLRTGRDHRRAHTRQTKARRRFAQPMLSIHERDFEPTDRTVAGNWEGDLIVGKQNRSAIGTFVERKTRTVKLLHRPSPDSQTLRAAVVDRPGKLPPELRTSLTWNSDLEQRSYGNCAQARYLSSGLVPYGPWMKNSVRLVIHYYQPRP